MMTHKAVVINVDKEGKATGEAARPNACSACGDESSCHSSDGSEIQLAFKNSGHLKPGDIIKIGIKKSSFYKSLTAVYVFPLVIMLLMAIAVNAIKYSTAGISHSAILLNAII